MAELDVLSLFKANLGITHTAKDGYLHTFILACQNELNRKGVVLTDSTDDLILLSDYAAWQYRNRNVDVPLARNIQNRIRNRIVRLRADEN